MQLHCNYVSGGLLFLLRQNPALLSGFTGTAVRTATPQLSLRGPTFSVAPEKVGKKMRLGRVILRADTREFWPLRGLNALFGRRIAIFPIAYGSDECTTRICGQTAIIPFLLISGILGGGPMCTRKG